MCDSRCKRQSFKVQTVIIQKKFLRFKEKFIKSTHLLKHNSDGRSFTGIYEFIKNSEGPRIEPRELTNKQIPNLIQSRPSQPVGNDQTDTCRTKKAQFHDKLNTKPVLHLKKQKIMGNNQRPFQSQYGYYGFQLYHQKLQ